MIIKNSKRSETNVQERQKRILGRKCKKIEEHMRENRSREMYAEIKSLTKSLHPRLGVIKDENGETVTESEKIIGRWKR